MASDLSGRVTFANGMAASGVEVRIFSRWMLLPDEGLNGTWRLTFNEWEKVRAELDKQRLVPLGQLRARATNMQEVTRHVWDNHQVLAYGYTGRPDGSVDIHIYDPNCRADDDDVVIHIEQVQAGELAGAPVYGLTCYERDCWEKRRPLRGFFCHAVRAGCTTLFLSFGVGWRPAGLWAAHLMLLRCPLEGLFAAGPRRAAPAPRANRPPAIRRAARPAH